MGGCCSSSRKLQLQGTPVYYYYPPALEEYQSLTSRDGSATTLLNSRLTFDFDPNMSIPDTFRPPPAPMPYDVVFGSPHFKEANRATTQLAFFPNSQRKVGPGPEFSMLSPLNVTKMEEKEEEEDVCPTCLEEYDSENPKIVTKCNHHFHLSCILEWQERSDTCPVCDQEMIYESPLGVPRHN
ncbi:RING-H2 finger B1A [Striga hermonthica]|uniref:RING-type E3 ubiquitin transferase n=1 Tax=Striga hermonthica TaxID=68872 RepID=A0A9N7MV52_STRHE|nr:RING-H2 finger B1A [Striga hermonthica]